MPLEIDPETGQPIMPGGPAKSFGNRQKFGPGGRLEDEMAGATSGHSLLPDQAQPNGLWDAMVNTTQNIWQNQSQSPAQHNIFETAYDIVNPGLRKINRPTERALFGKPADEFLDTGGHDDRGGAVGGDIQPRAVPEAEYQDVLRGQRAEADFANAQKAAGVAASQAAADEGSLMGAMRKRRVGTRLNL